jgi:hypothetical protein
MWWIALALVPFCAPSTPEQGGQTLGISTTSSMMAFKEIPRWTCTQQSTRQVQQACAVNNFYLW